MKKNFRMALVFALAGATLMYTGCTKDYDEDINALEQKVNALETDLSQKVSDLQGQVANLKSSISALEAADAALQKSVDANKADIKTLQDKVAAIEKAIADLNKYATKDELKAATDALDAKIAEAKQSILDEAKKLQDQIDELKEKLAADEEKIAALEAAQKEIDNVYGFLSDELRAIVFLPDFYFGGIESTSFDFVSLWGLEPVKLAKDLSDKVDHNKAPLVYKKDGKTTATDNVVMKNGKAVMYAVDPDTFDYIYGADGKPVVWNKNVKSAAGKDALQFPWFPANRTMGQLGVAYYDLNPSSFPTDSAEWRLRGMNRRYETKADEALFWAPVFEGITNNGGEAAVQYSIANPELVFNSIIAAFPACADSIAKAEAKAEPSEKIEVRETFKRMIMRMYTQFFEGIGDTNVPVMQLIATLSDGRDIKSDWHAVTSDEELVDHLAFTAASKYTTESKTDCGAVQNKKVDLYADAYLAGENEPSVPVKYNGGPVDLSKIIAIHTVSPATNELYGAYTLDEFTKKYPGFSYKFELIPYKIGNNVTEEQMYGQIDGNNFTPCWVESKDGKAVSHVIEKDSEDGVSSVGRFPIVLAYLVDEAGNSYAVGYFKIEIVKDAKVVDETWLEIPDLGKVPYICGPFTLRTNWHQFSYFVLEQLKVDYDEFVNDYTLKGIYGYESVKDAKGNKSTQFVPIVLAEAGKEAALKLDNANLNKDTGFEGYTFDKPGTDYGTAIYDLDNSGTGINDAFEWTVAGKAKDKSIYFKFEKSKYEVVYFEMKADVADAAKFDFGANKIANEWFDDINADPKNTARINVLVPNQDGDDVTEFYRDLKRFFIGYKPAMVLTDDADPVYKNYFDNNKNNDDQYDPAELEGAFKFYFSGTQPKVVFTDKDGNSITLADTLNDNKTVVDLSEIQLYVNNWDGGTSDSLYVPQFKKVNNQIVPVTEKKKVNGQEKDVPVLVPDRLIATLDTTGLVTYFPDSNTDVWSKKLLNLWSYTQTAQERMLYANVLVKTTYGECEIPAGDAGFYLRFVRPLDINFKPADVAQESAVNGFNVLVAEFFSNIVDWNKQSLIKPETEKKTVDGKEVEVPTGYFVENVISGVHMYQYYQFTELVLDLDNALRDNWDTKDLTKIGKLKDVTPEAQLALGTVDPETDVFTAGEGNSLDISDIENLKNAALNYRNDRAVVETFNLYIPVCINYAWGTISETLKIQVKKTADTDPK